MAIADGKRRYGCSSCNAVLCGVAVFRGLVGDEAVQHLWSDNLISDPPGTSAVTGDRSGHCPFCFGVMKRSQVPSGRAMVCRICEMIWIDPAALACLPIVDLQRGPRIQDLIPRCGNCGAAIEHSWDESCKFCGATVVAPTKVLVIPSPSGGGVGDGWRIVGKVLGGLFDVISPWP